MKMTGSSPRIADFKSPFASAAFEGKARRIPGMWAIKTAVDVAPDRHTNHHRCGPGTVGTIAKHRQLIPDLHEAGPNIIPKLNLRDGLPPFQSTTDRDTDNARLGER